jgi:hypothetical protein
MKYCVVAKGEEEGKGLPKDAFGKRWGFTAQALLKFMIIRVLA